MSAALPRDLHDALIIQIYDSHEVSYFVGITQSVTCPESYHLVAPVTVCVYFCFIEKPSTALWTRVRLHRLVCPPTTTLCLASITPGMTSHSERPVNHTHMLTRLALAVLLLCRLTFRDNTHTLTTVTSSSCYADSRLA